MMASTKAAAAHIASWAARFSACHPLAWPISDQPLLNCSDAIGAAEEVVADVGEDLPVAHFLEGRRVDDGFGHRRAHLGLLCGGGAVFVPRRKRAIGVLGDRTRYLRPDRGKRRSSESGNVLRLLEIDLGHEYGGQGEH
jgi:hypothetical protein